MREAALRTADTTLIAILASMFGLALLMAYWVDSYSDRRLELADAISRLRDLAGPDAVACGQVSRQDDPEPAVACVESAMRGKRAFWMIRENSIHPTIGAELHWQGFSRSAQGRQYRVHFMPRDKIGPQAYLSVASCPRIKSRLDSGAPGPTCMVSQGGRQYEWPRHWYVTPPELKSRIERPPSP